MRLRPWWAAIVGTQHEHCRVFRRFVTGFHAEIGGRRRCGAQGSAHTVSSTRLGKAGEAQTGTDIDLNSRTVTRADCKQSGHAEALGERLIRVLGRSIAPVDASRHRRALTTSYRFAQIESRRQTKEVKHRSETSMERTQIW